MRKYLWAILSIVLFSSFIYADLPLNLIKPVRKVNLIRDQLSLELLSSDCFDGTNKIIEPEPIKPINSEPIKSKSFPLNGHDLEQNTVWRQFKNEDHKQWYTDDRGFFWRYLLPNENPASIPILDKAPERPQRQSQITIQRECTT